MKLGKSKPVSAPVAFGDTVVAYVTQNKRLFLIGIDPETGDQLWRKPATPGYAAPGIAKNPAEVPGHDDQVAYYEPIADGNGMLAKLVVADAASGRPVHASDSHKFRSTIGECTDGTDLCVSTLSDEDGGATSWRLDVESGEFSAEQEVEGVNRNLHADIFDVRERGTQYLTRIVDGKEKWRIAVEDAFPAGSSSDFGWSFEIDEKSPVMMSLVGGKANIDFEADRMTRDLAGSGVAGINYETGEIVWSEQGRSSCSGIDWDLEVPVRCRSTGTMTSVISSDDSTEYDDTSTVFEGFDPRTGEATWSAGLDAKLTPADVESLPFADDHTAVLPLEDGQVVLDLLSGKRRNIRDDEVFVCEERTRFEFHAPIYYDGTPVSSHTGGAVASACDANAKPSAGELTVGNLAGRGAHIGDMAVIATSDTLVGYRVS